MVVRRSAHGRASSPWACFAGHPTPTATSEWPPAAPSSTRSTSAYLSLSFARGACQSQCGRRARAMRSWPARSGRISTSCRPAACRAPATAGPWPEPISSTSHPPGRSHSRPPRRQRNDVGQPVVAGVQRAVWLPLAHRRPPPARRPRRCTAGSTPPRRASPATPPAVPRTTSRRRTAHPPRPCPARRHWPGRHRAHPADTSVSHTSADPRGSSAASDSPMAPLPVPRSATSSVLRPPGPRAARTVGDRRLGHQLGLRPRDQHPPIDQQVEGAEAPVPQHVLQRLALAQPGQHRVEVRHLALGGGRVEHLEELVAERAAGLLTQPTRLRAAVQARPVSPTTAARRPRRAEISDRSWPASCLARSSAVRASTTSSRSPASTSCNR